MGDPQNNFVPESREESLDPAGRHEPNPPAGETAPSTPPATPAEAGTTLIVPNEESASRMRSFRRNLFFLFSLALAAFLLTSWILVRVDEPLGAFSSGPQETVRAQLRAVDRGELRPAYEMFSARYRGQVSFDAWHELVVSHWRMFHADVVRAGTPARNGPGITLELYLHGADHKDYRARFTLIHTDGCWWIDDVHWAEDHDVRAFSRT